MYAPPGHDSALLLAGSSCAARAIHRESDAKQRLDAAFRLLGETGDYPAAGRADTEDGRAADGTLADLGRVEQVSAKHLAEAVQYRSLDRNYWN